VDFIALHYVSWTSAGTRVPSHLSAGQMHARVKL
jgi:hypothetical protein